MRVRGFGFKSYLGPPMEPIITNDAVVLGLLLTILAAIFYTSTLKTNFWTKFYKFIPALLLCYFF